MKVQNIKWNKKHENAKSVVPLLHCTIKILEPYTCYTIWETLYELKISIFQVPVPSHSVLKFDN